MGQVELDPTVDFIAGTASGITGLIVGFPFDTVKVRFQNPETARKYHSTTHAITKIIREEKFAGLFKGIASPLATAALMNGLVFASYRFCMKIQLEHKDAVPTLAQVALAGTGCGIISSMITTPTELIKIKQQSSLIPTSAYQVTLQIFKEAGIRGLYRGFTATILRDSAYGTYFFTYEAASRLLTPASSSNATSGTPLFWPSLLVAGGVAGVVSWISTFPLDVVKTRIQGTAEVCRRGTLQVSGTPSLSMVGIVQHDANPYRTTLSTIVNSYRAEGAGVFFRGLAPTLIRAFPVNMVTFATFEAVALALS